MRISAHTHYAYRESGMDNDKDDIERTIALHLAARVRTWRRQRGLSLREMSALTDISQRTLEGIEQGRGFRYPNLLADALEGMDAKARRVAAGGQKLFIGAGHDAAADAGTGGQGTGNRRRHTQRDAAPR